MVKGSHFVPVNKTNVYRSDFGTESLLKVKPNTYIIRNVNKASNWQIVTQIKKFSDLCDRICFYSLGTMLADGTQLIKTADLHLIYTPDFTAANLQLIFTADLKS